MKKESGMLKAGLGAVPKKTRPSMIRDGRGGSSRHPTKNAWALIPVNGGNRREVPLSATGKAAKIAFKVGGITTESVSGTIARDNHCQEVFKIDKGRGESRSMVRKESVATAHAQSDLSQRQKSKHRQSA